MTAGTSAALGCCTRSIPDRGVELLRRAVSAGLPLRHGPRELAEDITIDLIGSRESAMGAAK
jgi:hypothetical protein